MGEDLRERIRGAEGTMQRLAQYIPGFSGYRERGIRRKADEQVRMHLVGLLDDVIGRLQHVLVQWSDGGRLEGLDRIDRVLGRVRKTRDGLRYADYGYTGWWDAVKIKEAELDTMYQYDLNLRELIVAIDAAVEDLVVAAEEDLSAKLAAVDEQTARLQHALDHRGEVVAGMVP